MNVSILIWLHRVDHMQTPSDIDRFISAEIPDKDLDPELYGLVTTCLMHGPCGLNNPSAPCMVDGKCSKNFPKEFSEHTTLAENGYPLYQRRNNGRFHMKNGVPLDNRYGVRIPVTFLVSFAGAHVFPRGSISVYRKTDKS